MACNSTLATLSLDAALALVDFSGRRSQDVGDFDGCAKTSDFAHCLVRAPSSGILLGACIPAACVGDAADAQSPMRRVLELLNPIPWFAIAQSGGTVEMHCDARSDSARGPLIAFSCVLAAFATAVLAASAWTAWARQRDRSSLINAAAAISLQSSLAALMKRQAPTDGTVVVNLAPLNGLRVLSLGMVVLGHSLLIAAGAPGYTNAARVLRGFEHWEFQVLPGAQLGVDTFFVLSGAMGFMALLRLLQGARTAATAVVAFAINRLVRLLPLLGVTIAFIAYVLPHTGSGPFWWAATEEAARCRRTGWANAALVNNFVGPYEDQCAGWTWYLAVDTQLLLVLLPAVVCAYHYRPWVGVTAVAAAAAGSLAAGCALSATHHLSSFPLGDPTVSPAEALDDYRRYMNEYYAAPWMRAPAMLAGVVLGMVWTRRQDEAPPSRDRAASSDEGGKRDGHLQAIPAMQPAVAVYVRLNEELDGRASRSRGPSFTKTAVQLPLSANGLREDDTCHGIRSWRRYAYQWAVVVALAAVLGLLLFSPADLYQRRQAGTDTWPRGLIVAYTALSRPLWSAGVAGIAYVLSVGGAAPLGAVLGAAMWVPLARLTYGVYLVHSVVMMTLYHSRATLIRYAASQLTAAFIGQAVLSAAVALPLWCFIEFPAAELCKRAFQAWNQRVTARAARA